MLITQVRSVTSDSDVLLGRELALECVRKLDNPYGLRHRCPTCGGVDHGIPLVYLANVSIARISGFIAAAATLGKPIGIAIGALDWERNDLVIAAATKAWGGRLPAGEIAITDQQISVGKLSCSLTWSTFADVVTVVAQQLPEVSDNLDVCVNLISYKS